MSSENSMMMSNDGQLEQHKTVINRKNGVFPVTSEDDEMEPLPAQPSGKHMLKDKSTMEICVAYLENHLQGLPPHWRNWVVRGIFSVIMISFFVNIVRMGPMAISILIVLIQIKCFHEIIHIGYFAYRSDNLPYFRSLSWYFLFTSNYWFYGENLINHFGLIMRKNDFLQPLVTYHRMISFSLYTGGFVFFVWSLKKTYYLKQFTLFGYTHFTLMILVTSSQQMIQNVWKGTIWLLFPVAAITCNDVMAYVFGFFYGRTQLTQLSPKKTWEGFIGGGISTLLFGFFFAGFLCHYEGFLCPVEYNEELMSFTTSCIPDAIFQKTTYIMPRPFSWLKRTMNLYPFQLHSIVLSLFASIIGPFGGFFASGFKRAFRLKDFAATIPGHGGFVDRFDCQILMALFTNVYMTTFMSPVSPYNLVQQVLALSPENREQFLQLLNDYLKKLT